MKKNLIAILLAMYSSNLISFSISFFAKIFPGSEITGIPASEITAIFFP